MKSLLKKLIVAVGVVALSTAAYAQDYSGPQYAKYGADPKDREANILNYNRFTEAYKAKDYPTATKSLKELLERAPMASQNLYAMGTTIYKSLIASAKDENQITNYIDSLMILHDIRLQHFASDAKRGTSYIMTEKLKDYIRYKDQNIDDIVTLANAVIKATTSRLDVEMLPAYFNFLAAKYNDGGYKADNLISEYDFLVNKLKGEPESDEVKSAIATIDQIFMQSGVANCDNIEKIYKPQVDANPSDADLIKKVSVYLARAQCNSAFQNEIAEKSYAIEPNAAAAVMLAVAFEAKGEKDKAKSYFKEAIALETDPATKADYSIRAAGAALQDNQPREAAEFAKAALESNPNSATAYMLLGQAYAVGASSACSGFARSATYWLVVDTLVKARELAAGDESLSSTISDQIRLYSGYFPKTEDMFFSDPPVQNGSGYTVSCGWISGRTTARGR